MKIFGINALNHDTSICVLDNKILFHKRSSNNYQLTDEIVQEALNFGKPDIIAWYENVWFKKIRQFYAGQYRDALSFKNLPTLYLKKFNLESIPIIYVPHHISHAQFGAYSSGFDSTAILVADGIGEWNTISIWSYKQGKLKRIMNKNYPYSLGLFYSAFTELIGLTPIKDESSLTALSQKGDPFVFYKKVSKYLKQNLHKGIWNWDVDVNNITEITNIAASVQYIFEEEIIKFANIAKNHHNKLVFTGGCAYNNIVISKIKELFEDFHVPKFPGDAGCSIGAALYVNKKIHNKY